ncbi:MAG: redoxin family protein [Candidatus Eisenbacteria bacterium]
MLRRLLPLASLALLIAGPATSARGKAPAAAPPALVTARTELDSIGSVHARLSHYRFEGLVQVVVTGKGVNQKVEMPVLFVFERPARLHTEMQNPNMGSVLVSDGDTLTISVPTLHQYTRQPAPSLLPGSGNDAFARQVDPLGDYVRIASTATSVRAVGRDTVQVGDRVIDAVKLEVTSPADTSVHGLFMHPRTLWVDPASHRVLRDSVRVDIEHPQIGPVTSIQVTRLVRFSDAAPADSLFRFRPHTEDRLVARIGASGTEGPQLEGRLAPDFSLPRLAQASRAAKPPSTAKARAAAAAARTVKLSALRGKVVVLDFWATWCGPCRRWMPLVDKAHTEFGPKGLQVFAVNLRESEELVRGFLQKTGVKVPVLLDRDGSVGAAYGASSIPLTVIVGRDGKVVRALLGAHPEADLRAALREAGIE